MNCCLQCKHYKHRWINKEKMEWVSVCKKDKEIEPIVYYCNKFEEKTNQSKENNNE